MCAARAWFAALAALLLVGRRSVAQPSVAELAERLAGIEARVSDLELEVFVAGFTQSAEGQLQPSPCYSSIRWSFRAPYGQFFYMDETAGKEWIGGPRPIAFIRNMCAYDGRNSTSLSYYGRDPLELQRAICENRPISGSISKELDPYLKTFVEGYQLGLPWRGTRTLSDLLSHAAKVEVREVSLPEFSNPVYRVFIPFDAAIGDPPQCLYLDPTRDLAIVRWEHVRGADDTDTRKEVFECRALAEAITGVWLPAEATYRDFRTRPIEVREFTLTDVRINRGLDETRFSIEFPPETLVTGRRNGRDVYRIGFTPAELDRMMQVQAKMARQALAKADVQGAKRLPLLAAPHQVYVADEGRPARRWGVLVIPAATGAAAVGAMTWFMRKREPSRRALALATALVLGSVSAAAFLARGLCPGTTAGTKTFSAPPDWERIAPGAKPRPIGPRPAQDCGQYVLCFLAQLYETGWNAEAITANEAPAGVMSLARICDMLIAMGLSANGIRLSDPDQARDLLRTPGTSLVLVTTVGRSQTSHFFCVLGTSGDQFLVADPPRPVHFCSTSGIREAMSRGGGYAVLVRKG